MVTTVNATRLTPARAVTATERLSNRGLSMPMLALCAVGMTVLSGMPAAAMADPASSGDDLRRYTYSWQFADGDAMAPRGGTTKGPPVTLDPEPGAAWRALREPGLSKQERDRRAILAMAGGFRASFDFIETAGFVADYAPSAPYQSWGTEYVYVVEDEPDFVSLQHILVMYFDAGDGEVSGPAVVKHWRQDWQYEDRGLHVYAGHDTWVQRKRPRRDVRGTWSQSVFQVDDSPRYQAVGRWEHNANHSSWQSETTWRPLPRREFSVRDDYHVLSGTNRHTVTPTGWIHEEDNLKVVLDANGEPSGETPYLAREAGLNRYERIVDHDFSAGDRYWEATGPFWADVRAAWRESFDRNRRLTLKKKVDDRRLFQEMFAYASRVEEAGSYDAESGRAFIGETLDDFLQ